MTWRVGIDIGGTFSDLAAADLESGELFLRKVSSTPAALAEGAIAGLKALSEAVPLASVSFLAHGTTVGTNALIEGRGARTGLLTTEGFRDLLEIARQQRPSLYNLRARKPRVLAPRLLRREIPERMRFDGETIRPVDLEATGRELLLLREHEVESLAICFLHSYANPAHERAVKDLARDLLPGVYISASSDLLPRFREWERLSTTVVNAYLGPLMDRYLGDLARRVEALGTAVPPAVMQSNGGLCSMEEARVRPAATVLSGPAAAAAAAAGLCAGLGLERAISIDMGGTSTDVCLIEGGVPASVPEREVGGHAVQLPAVDVRSIGSGGGSLLTIDAGGLPQVGPRSAGADPGPACYGKGGEYPTLTDAFLLLGRLPSDGLLDGEIALDSGAANRAVTERFARPLGLGAERAAAGGVELAVASTRRAVESLTVARGRDPRQFTLICAGGAGPLIACDLASALQIEEVVIPPSPGVLSAWGLLVSDARRDWVQSAFLPASPTARSKLTTTLNLLEDKAQEWLRGHSSDAGNRMLRAAAARYVGQDHELSVALPPGELDQSALLRAVEDFHATHEDHHGYALPDQQVEFVDLIVTAIVGTRHPSHGAVTAEDGRARRAHPQPVFTPETGWLQACPVRNRRDLGEGAALQGPVLIRQYDSTTFVAPGYCVQVDGTGSLRIRSAAEGRV
jgi:N-methylhydantoinase A